MLAAALLSVIPLTGCQHLVIHTDRILKGDVSLPEIVGIIAGFGTTFAAFPDFLAMLKRCSSLGMHPRMGAIMGAFQILWVYYGLHRFAAGDHLECYCSVHQLSHGGGIRLFPAQGKGKVSD